MQAAVLGHGDLRVPVLVENTCGGSVRLVNCALWGPNRQCVVSHSRSFVSLSDCYLSSTGRTQNPGVSLIWESIIGFLIPIIFIGFIYPAMLIVPVL